MKTLFRKEIEITLLLLAIATATAILLMSFLEKGLSVGIATTILLPYFLYLGNSEKTFLSVPDRAKAFIKANSLGKILKIEDVEIRKKYHGTCEYDITEDRYIERTIVTTKGKIRVKEGYLNSAEKYYCDCIMI